MKKYKILFVAPSNSVHTLRWLERFTSSGHEAHLFDLYTEGAFTLQIPRYFLRPLDNKGLLADIKQTFLIYKFLKDLIEKEKFDAIHLHWLFHQAPFAATFLKKIPIVSTSWGSDIQVPWRPLKIQLKKKIINIIMVSRIARKSIFMCCDSQAQKRILVRRGSSENRVKIIYFGTDINKFRKQNRSFELRDKLGANSDTVLVLSNRNHEDVYDIPTFVRAAKIASAVNDRLRFVIAGSGTNTNNLIDLVRQLDIESKVVFPGRLDDSDFANLSASCDVYVSTSKSDGGLAASTAEAMASEIPVLVSNFGENSDWLRNQTAGFVFNIGDEVSLANLIIKLSNDSLLRSELGKKGRGIIERDNNSEIEWEKVKSLYQLVVEQ